MKDGFIRIAVASIPVHVADPRANAEEILRAMERAEEARANLLLLPELCVTGYSCGDLFGLDTLLTEAREALAHIVEASRDFYTVTIVSLPLRVGAGLYNCAVPILRGRILGAVPKVHLPNHGEFYKARQFTPGTMGQMQQISLCGQSVPFGAGLLFAHEALDSYCFGVEICEDAWVVSPPSEAMALSGATILLNPSASDEVIGKAAYRRELIRSTSAREICAYAYASAAPSESTQDMVFSGHLLICENGALLAEQQPLADAGMIFTEVDLQRLRRDRHQNTGFRGDEGLPRVNFAQEIRETPLSRQFEANPFVPSNPATVRERTENILRIQTCGLKKRLEHTRASTAVIGVSGGLDSTLALLVAARAMDALHRPRTDVLAATMPCFGTTRRTKSNAVVLCEALGVTLKEIDIAASVKQHLADIGHDPSVTDVTYENAQARERTQVLMDLANQSGGMVIGTGDLSELALGWATYNGDHMSMYAVNSSVPKTLVRHIIRFEADRADSALQAVLMDILDTPVSPELLPASADGEISQRTEDLVGPYALHDFFLYHLLRFGSTPKKILRLALHAFDGEFDEATIRRWLTTFLRRFFAQQFKRSCLPDGPKVGSVTLSPRGDWRMPSDACAQAWLRELDEI